MTISKESQQPAPPPEAAVISAALKRSRSSQREAAKRAGISEAWWRRVMAGQDRGMPVNTPAATLARMAQAVAVTPEELTEGGGRPEVIEELRALVKAEEADLGKPFRIIDVALEEYTLEEQEEILQRYVDWKRREDGTEDDEAPAAM